MNKTHPYIELHSDDFLSKYLNKRSFQLKISQETEHIIGDTELIAAECSKLKDWQSCGCFLYCKTGLREVWKFDLLQRLGFYLVDTSVLLSKNSDAPINIKSLADIGFADSVDKSSVMEVAADSFTFSRFHLDYHISNQQANQIKAAWAGNYFSGERGDSMVVARLQKNCIGFLQLLRPKPDTLVIDLIAVDKKWRRHKIAGDMIAWALNAFAGEVDNIQVGTQVANFPSLRFYLEQGFKIVDGGYVFHCHDFRLLQV